MFTFMNDIRFKHGLTAPRRDLIDLLTTTTMSDEEDYLSDKFLVETSGTTQPKTYAQRRQEALKQSRQRNEQNRTKSRRQREQESREDGLSKSLFERARQDKDAGANKALGIMMKMGFQLGQSLGRSEDSPPTKVAALPDTSHSPPASHTDSSKQKRNVEPLPLNEWAGKKGIGLGKRSRSAGASERIAKMAKMADEAERESFRDRSRREYEQRHAESRLVLAQRTCSNLDEEAGISFNVFWLNPNDADTIPPSLSGALSESFSASSAAAGGNAAQLRKQLQADALVSMGDNDVDDDDDVVNERQPESRHQEVFTLETLKEAVHFLRLGPCDRLSLVLAYLREEYTYCFWCGTRYDDYADLKQHCPGPGEEDHD